MDDFGGIYAIVNMTNGHKYIGSAINIYNRWKCHRSELRRGIHANQILQRAWNKHGESVFEILVLASIDRKEDLISNEQIFIDSLHPEYNILPTAGSCLGFIPSDETRQKMSASRKGARNGMFGKKHSQETRRKIGEKSVGRIKTADVRDRISEAGKGNKYNFGHKASEETRRKMSEIHKGLLVGERNPQYGKPGNKYQTGNTPVSQFTKAGELIGNFLGVREAERLTGIFRASISRCAKSKQHTAGGFIWRYA